MKRWIPKSIRKQIRISGFYWGPVFWANLGPVSRLLAHLVPTLSPTILVLSTPRSGSSWVGHILGISNSTLYLREPITQTYLTYREGNGPSWFEVTSDRFPMIYKSSADAAFAGLPVFPPSIVKSPEKWSLFDRVHKRLVIKEVNPLAIEWFINNYEPRIIYLIRHPAAVANSVFGLRWTGNLFEKRFSAETLTSMDVDYRKFKYSFWAEFGALQSIVLQLSLQALKGKDYRIVKYEDLCTNPLDIFRELYYFASLDWSSEVEKQIMAHSTFNGSNTTGTYDVYRNSQAMIDKWKTEMSEETINTLKKAYLYYDPPHYGIEEW
jgi:hypothetical protein